MPNWKQLVLNRIGNPDAHALTSLTAKLGDAAQTFLTMIGYQGATSLADKLTAARAGYLDNINNAQLLNVPDLSTLTAARIGYLDNINQAGLLQVTAIRAGYLDNLSGGAVALASTALSTATWTATRAGYLDRIRHLTRPQAGTQATTADLTVVGAAIESAVPIRVSGYLSAHNLQVGDTVLVVEEIRDQDDTTYREYARASYSGVQNSPMVWFNEKVCQGWRVRVQRTAGVDRTLNYQFFTDTRSV